MSKLQEFVERKLAEYRAAKDTLVDDTSSVDFFMKYGDAIVTTLGAMAVGVGAYVAYTTALNVIPGLFTSYSTPYPQCLEARTNKDERMEE